MHTFNGHKNWNHWNVSLWINNDERLYRMARGYTRYLNRQEAAAAMLAALQNATGRDNPETPDGAPYSISSIRAAMREM